MNLKRGVFRRRGHSMPGLNTAALPDLIFTVLFFFMIVTHMRDVEPLVRYEVPAGTEIRKTGHKSAVTYIYVGRPAMQTAKDTFCIQLNNHLATVADIREYIEEERARMSDEDRTHIVVSLKADRDVPMSLIAEIKHAQQQSYALRISYTATERGER